MSDVVHRTTLEFRRSVNNTDFPEPEWKWSPDMSAVAGVPTHHQKWDAVAERPVPKSQAGKDAADASRDTAAKDSSVARLENDAVLMAAFRVIRGNGITDAAFLAQVRAELD